MPESPPDLGEPELLVLALKADPEATLRRVFDNSHLLGVGFRNHYRVDLTLVDLAALLPQLGCPCTAEGLSRSLETQTARTSRSACAASATQGQLCAYWRECLHGLVSGLSTSVYSSRVASPQAGGDTCVDLLHVDAQSPHRYAPVPEAMRAPLEEAHAALARVAPTARIEFLGLVEGALHLRIDDTGPKCGMDTSLIVERVLRRALPDLQIRDASPRAVLEPSP